LFVYYYVEGDSCELCFVEGRLTDTISLEESKCFFFYHLDSFFSIYMIMSLF